VKTHYELLGLEITADADAIKKAFRREIARYHPDKVIHLGTEFQEMAATRAAELTVAYKTLSDEAMRAEYDASLTSGVPPPHVPHVPPDEPDEPPPRAERRPESSPGQLHDTPPTIDEIKTPLPVGGGKGRFAAERADRDVILKRAIGARVMATVEGLYGKLTTPAVRGFDLAMVPLAKPRFMGTMPPRVLVKVVDSANTATVTEAYAGASKANVHAGKSPVVVLLFARNIAPQDELTKANETNARRKGDGPDEVAVIVVNTADWSCRLPPGCSPAVRKLADQVCA
jgi:hypothetical protein